MRQYHKDGTIPGPESEYIWVFGSNLAGHHGAGAARVAVEKFGAKFGVSSGITGRAYAIPTKDKQLHTLGLHVIAFYANSFIQYAINHPELCFYVTRVGCGYAGLTDAQMMPLFKGCPDSCNLPEEWREK